MNITATNINDLLVQICHFWWCSAPGAAVAGIRRCDPRRLPYERYNTQRTQPARETQSNPIQRIRNNAPALPDRALLILTYTPTCRFPYVRA
jgi:hypothetical protein